MRRGLGAGGQQAEAVAIVLEDCFDSKWGNAYAAAVSSISKGFGEQVPQTLHTLGTVLSFGFGLVFFRLPASEVVTGFNAKTEEEKLML